LKAKEQQSALGEAMSSQFQPSDLTEEKIFWDTELDVNSFSSSYFKATQRDLHKRQ